MQDQPTDRDLIAAVANFLQTEVAPTLTDHRLKFRALVAANVLTIVNRERDLGDAQLQAERARLQKLFALAALPPSPKGRGAGGEGHERGEGRTDNDRAAVATMTQELAHLIRAGKADQGAFHDAVFAHVEQTVIEKLQIANPKYLERVQSEIR